MNTGRTLFAQLMDFVPWSTFGRLVVRYDGDRRVRTLNCAEQYRAMAFAQLTYRESLRDIETCLAAQSGKLYAMGFRDPVRRSTLGQIGSDETGPAPGRLDDEGARPPRTVELGGDDDARLAERIEPGFWAHPIPPRRDRKRLDEDGTPADPPDRHVVGWRRIVA